MEISINDKTKISLYAVAAAVPFLIGGILWLSSVASDAKEARSEVSSLRNLVLSTHDAVVRIEVQIQQLKRGK